MWKWLSGFLERHVGQDVPPELSYCESECRKTSCSDENFAICAERLRHAPGARPFPLNADPTPRPAPTEQAASRVYLLRKHPRFRG